MNDNEGVTAESLQVPHIHSGFIFLLEAIVYIFVVGLNFKMNALQITAYKSGDSFSRKCFKSPDPLHPTNALDTIFGVSYTADRFQFDHSLKQKFRCPLDPCAW